MRELRAVGIITIKVIKIAPELWSLAGYTNHWFELLPKECFFSLLEM